jgi:hypothetical protein
VSDATVHLTNDAVQKKNPKKNPKSSYGKYEEANKLSMAEFQQYGPPPPTARAKGAQKRGNGCSAEATSLFFASGAGGSSGRAPEQPPSLLRAEREGAAGGLPNNLNSFARAEREGVAGERAPEQPELFLSLALAPASLAPD